MGKHKEKYLEPKEKARRTVYQAKCKADRKTFANVMLRDDQKCDVFKIGKRMVKTNQDIIGEQCIRNDDGLLAVTDEDKKVAWDRNSLSQADTVSGVPHLIDNDMVRESISNTKNGKTAGPPDVCQKW